MISISALFEGKVQGVGFRSSVLSLAKGYEVTGWVKNLPDGPSKSMPREMRTRSRNSSKGSARAIWRDISIMST